MTTAAGRIALIDAAIEALITGTPVQAIYVGNMRLDLMTIDQLRRLRADYQTEYQRATGSTVRHGGFTGFRD